MDFYPDLKIIIKQLSEARHESFEANNQIIELRKDISLKERAHHKLKNDLETVGQKMAEKNDQVKKMKTSNKKLWNLIVEMSETLSKIGLLTVKRKEQFLKEIDEQMTNSELGSEGENIKVSLSRLRTASPAKPNATPPQASLAKSNATVSSDSVTVNSPASSAGRQLNTSSDNCITSDKKSYTSKDVISEDYNDSFGKQFSALNDPLPTQPPKNAMSEDSQPKSSPSALLTSSHFNPSSFVPQFESNLCDFRQNQHTLVNAARPKEVIYLVLKYIISSRANPLLTYFKSENESDLMPLTEKCIVQSLLQIGRTHRLIQSVVDTAYELILCKESFDVYGLSSLCRVLTEICRLLDDRKRPLMLCSELLKFQHKFAPFLIASVASVWKELFSASNVTDEEMIFHSCIVYGTKKKPHTLTKQQWKQCKKVLSLYLSAHFPHQINHMVTFLVKSIQEICLTGFYEAEFILTTPLILFAAVKGWNWAKESLIDNHIIPLLLKHSAQANKKAFTFLSQLYADVCYDCPNEEYSRDVLRAFFDFKGNKSKDREFVRHAAAMAQMKLFLQKKELLPLYLTQDWIHEMKNISEYVEPAEQLLRRRRMNFAEDFLYSEVL